MSKRDRDGTEAGRDWDAVDLDLAPFIAKNKKDSAVKNAAGESSATGAPRRNVLSLRRVVVEPDPPGVVPEQPQLQHEVLGVSPPDRGGEPSRRVLSLRRAQPPAIESIHDTATATTSTSLVSPPQPAVSTLSSSAVHAARSSVAELLMDDEAQPPPLEGGEKGPTPEDEKTPTEVPSVLSSNTTPASYAFSRIVGLDTPTPIGAALKRPAARHRVTRVPIPQPVADLGLHAFFHPPAPQQESGQPPTGPVWSRASTPQASPFAFYSAQSPVAEGMVPKTPVGNVPSTVFGSDMASCSPVPCGSGGAEGGAGSQSSELAAGWQSPVVVTLPPHLQTPIHARDGPGDHLAVSLTPLSKSYQFRPEDRLGEGTYGAVYVGYAKDRPNYRVAIKQLKQLPNFEGFPITSVREIAVHRHLQRIPEATRSRLLVMEDLRFEFVDGAAEGVYVDRTLNSNLPPALQNLPAHKRGMSVGAVVAYLVFPYVEHSLSSLRRTLRYQRSAAAAGGVGGTAQLAQAFQHGFAHERQGNAAGPSQLSLNQDYITVIMVQLLEGLHQLHRARIMHRDIKEDNVLITADGRVKICDFGLAVPLEGDRARITPSLINMFYRPPEMLLRAAKYSIAVDVWSAGCLFAQQFLGVPPFISADGQPGTDLDQLLRITSVLGPLPRNVIDEQCDPDVRQLILNHPHRDRLCENVRTPNAAAAAANLNQRRAHFYEWFKKVFEARRKAHPTSVAVAMPSPDIVVLIHAMLSLDPKTRSTVEALLQCRPGCSAKVPGASLLAGSHSMHAMQAALVIQQSMCWVCRAHHVAPSIREEIARIPVPKTHTRQ